MIDSMNYNAKNISVKRIALYGLDYVLKYKN